MDLEVARTPRTRRPSQSMTLPPAASTRSFSSGLPGWRDQESMVTATKERRNMRNVNEEERKKGASGKIWEERGREDEKPGGGEAGMRKD